MPQRKFANQKALIDYAEQNGLVYVWAWIERQRVISPAFTKRKRLLSPDQYEIVDVHTSRGVRTAMLFPKAILQAEFAANARYARSWRSNESDGGRSGRRSKSDSYHEKRGGPLAGRKPPRRETQVLNVAEISRSRCQQQQQSSPRSATSVNPSAEAIFWTTFILPDTVASMPTQAAPRIRRASMVQDEHFAAAGLLGRVMARLRGF